MSHQIAGLCAELIRRRIVPRTEFPELADDLSVRAEVTQRLIEVGLVLLDRPGIPYLGVAVAEPYRSGDSLTDVDLDRSALGLLLYLWLQLVAPARYGSTTPLNGAEQLSISEEALLQDLPGGMSKTHLKSTITRLCRLNFLQRVRGSSLLRAGPMLWLAIDHDNLIHVLRAQKGLPFAVQRAMKQAGVEEEEQ